MLANEQALAEQAKLDLDRAEADVLEARERLSALMGLSESQINWTIGPRLPDLPPDEVPPQGLEALAVAQRLDLLAAGQSATASARSLSLAKRSRLIPSVQAGGSFERDTGRQTVAGPAFALPLPLLDQGQAAIARSQAALRQSRRRYESLAVQVRSDVRKARDHLYAARARAAYYQSVVLPLRARIVEESQRLNNGMLLGLFALLQARQEEVRAGGEYVESLRDYWLARVELERAAGGRLPRGVAASPATMPKSAPSEPTPTR